MSLSAGSLPSSHIDLICLSLAPFRWRRHLGEQLRAGQPAGRILEQLLHNPRLNRDGLDRATLATRAAAAIARASERRVNLIAWDDASYPAALSAIPDPPPVLWASGNLSALTSRAVAIVGSRAG